ncbi:MFS general substrate transporter [Hyaloscypha variabilis F]|uniref:MFS general substrate transporter n=1 Tax=Hyaloscypha variabilis (strain UAMH 11265 / GT02V1 / F) TaxID=1149755 RepID=A0A2J6QYZ3_HYAVF|nr:MFS general substrate transporter [Hyaloscypha variabilis F]
MVEKNDATDTEFENEPEPVVAPEIAEEDQLNEDEYPKGFQFAFILIALILSIFMVALDLTIVATAIPKITDEFKSVSQIGWYGSAFFLTVASFTSSWGKLFKYFTLKWTYLTAVFLFELGSLICAVAPTSTALIIGRAIAGLGAAGVGSGAFILVAFIAPPQKRPAYLGIIGASYGISAVIGPLLGGVFTEKATWRWCFYINLPIGGLAAAILVIFFRLPAHVKPAEATFREKMLQLDPIGIVLIMAAVICYVLALQWGGLTHPWSSSTIIGLFVGFGLLLLCFCFDQWYMEERAMLPKRLLKDRYIHQGMAYSFTIAGTYFLVLYFLPIYFQVIDNVSPIQSGVRNLPLILAITLATIVSGVGITVTGRPMPFMIVAGVLSTVGVGLLFTLTIGSSSAKWIGYQVIAGLGLGLGFQVPVSAVQATLPQIDIPSGSAMIIFVQTIGGAFLVSAGEAAFESVLTKKLRQTDPSVDPLKVIGTGATDVRSTFAAKDIPFILRAYVDGIQTAFIVAIALAAACTVISFGTRWRKLQSAQEPRDAVTAEPGTKTVEDTIV